jgi:hypothetical protein
MNSTNITIDSAFALATCLDLVTHLANYSGNYSEISFRSPGIEFVHVGNNHHVPILVNESLFKFLHILWTFGTIALIILVVVFVLSWLNHFCRWFCPVDTSTFAGDTQLSPIVRRPGRNSELIELTYKNTIIPFIDSYFLKPTLTKDNFFTVSAFLQKNLSTSGLYLEVKPKVHCPNVNCLPEHCELQHTFHVWIPCATTVAASGQIKLIYPTNPGPVPLKSVAKYP